MLCGRDWELLKQWNKLPFPKLTSLEIEFSDTFKTKKGACPVQAAIIIIMIITEKNNKICIESLNVLAINYSTDNRPGPKHFGKQLQMKHGTSISLAWPVQRAKKVVSDSPGLVDFAIGLVFFVLNLPDGQVLFVGEIEITEGLLSILPIKKGFGASWNDLWASTCYLQLARMAGCKTDFLCTLPVSLYMYH